MPLILLGVFSLRYSKILSRWNNMINYLQCQILLKLSLPWPWSLRRLTYFFMSPNPIVAAKIVVSMVLSSWWYDKPSNIPHGWHSKFIKDVTNFMFEGSLTCFLWDTLKSFLVHSIQFSMNFCHINPKPWQDHLTGSGGTPKILNLVQIPIHTSRAIISHRT